MYLDTDCVLALIKDSDWLKDIVESRLEGEEELITSVLTVIECQLVASREYGRERMHDVGRQIERHGIAFVPLDERTLHLSNELLKRYGFLGIFDSIHAATSIMHDKVLLSTDHVYRLMDEPVSEDPRGLSLDLGAITEP